MKKILAIAMAIVMMMAIAVPAFAAIEYENNGGEGSTTTVKVNGIDDMGDGTYTVAIPAQITLSWDSDGEDEYYITSQVQTDKRVQVTVAKSQDLVNGTDASETISFEAVDSTDGKADAAVVNDEEHKFAIDVDDNAWATASIADYTGYITFTATLVNA